MEEPSESHYVASLSRDCANYEEGLGLHIALFTDVQNTAELLDRSVQENATFVDAAVVLSLEQLLVAVNRSLYLRAVGKSRMNSFFAEILFNLSISKNITESLKQLGIEKLKDQESTNLVVITIDKTNAAPALFGRIKGRLLSPTNDNLAKTCDLNLIKKLYKTVDVSLIESKIAAKEYLH